MSLAALRDADFDWVRLIRGVWQDDPAHIEQINRSAYEEILSAFAQVGAASPLGRVVVGPAGAGKTHLLGALRRALLPHAWFVLVDMTDVRDFWETVLQGYLESLRQQLADGSFQFQRLLIESMHLFASLPGAKPIADYGTVLRILREQPLAEIVRLGNTIIANRLRPNFPHQALEFQDVFRALLLLNAGDFEISNLGHSWLLGLELEPAQRSASGLSGMRRSPRHVVGGLSWLMSLTRPTLLALDQLDAFVGQYAAPGESGGSEEAAAAGSILQGLGNGLLDLRETTLRTLSVLSCLEATWQVLTQRAVRSATQRFHPPILLPPAGAAAAQDLVAARLAIAYRMHGFTPPYPSYPFRPEAFAEAAGARLPRDVLMDCERHRGVCLARGRVEELLRFGVPDAAPRSGREVHAAVAQRFSALAAAADIAGLVDDSDAADLRLGALVAAACRCAAREAGARQELDFLVDIDFPGARENPSLHARLRAIEHEHHDRERHYSFRVLNRSHHIAYQNRLKVALTAAGIKAGLSFRRLVIVRNPEPPRGNKTQALTAELIGAGGRLARVSDNELKNMLALEQLAREAPPGFEEWLRAERPAARLDFLREAGFAADFAVVPSAGSESAAAATAEQAPSLPAPHGTRTDVAEVGQWSRSGQGSAAPTPAVAAGILHSTPAAPERPGPIAVSMPVHGSDPAAANPNAAGVPNQAHSMLRLGRRLLAGQPAEPVRLELAALTTHCAVLAGSGSGKTVLLRRLIEECALLGVPSIVLDPGNDLASLGDRWPEPPAGWEPGDAAKAEAYLRQTDVRVWTPGLKAGRPLSLVALPDLSGLAADGDELEQGLMMALDTIGAVAVPGSGARAEKMRGVLMGALRLSAAIGRSGLANLVELLADLPAEASDIRDARKIAADLSDQLKARMETDILWRTDASPLDPAELFGIGAARTRVSVINLGGLPALESKRAFVNQLAMSLFAWVQRHPPTSTHPLRGLLVLDEARDFAPSRESVTSKENLLRLARQARKYGLGLVFATQEPKALDHAIIASCVTQAWGRVSSPQAIEVVQAQAQQCGGRADDIARLNPGEFYIHSRGFSAPLKTRVPMCLSHHPGTPLDPAAVIARARR